MKKHILHVSHMPFFFFYNPTNQKVVKLTSPRQYALAYNIFPLNKRNMAFQYLSTQDQRQRSLLRLHFWTSPTWFSGRAEEVPVLCGLPYAAMLWKQSRRILHASAQRQDVLGSWGEQPNGFSWGLVVAVVENQGLLDSEEGNRLVPHVRGGKPTAELALQSCAELQGPVRAPPLQNHHLAHAERKQGQTPD